MDNLWFERFHSYCWIWEIFAASFIWQKGSSVLFFFSRQTACSLLTHPRTSSCAFPVRRHWGAEAWALGVQIWWWDPPESPAAASQTGLGHLHPQEPGEPAPICTNLCATPHLLQFEKTLFDNWRWIICSYFYCTGSTALRVMPLKS